MADAHDVDCAELNASRIDRMMDHVSVIGDAAVKEIYRLWTDMNEKCDSAESLLGFSHDMVDQMEWANNQASLLRGSLLVFFIDVVGWLNANDSGYTARNRLLSDKIWGMRAAVSVCRKLLDNETAALLVGAIAQTAGPTMNVLFSVEEQSATAAVYRLASQLCGLVDAALPQEVPSSVAEVINNFEAEHRGRVCFLSLIKMDDEQEPMMLPSGYELHPDRVREFMVGYYSLLGIDIPLKWERHTQEMVRPCPAPLKVWWPGSENTCSFDPCDMVTAAVIARHAGVNSETFLAKTRSGGKSVPVLPPPVLQKAGCRPAQWSYSALLAGKHPQYKRLADVFQGVPWPRMAAQLRRMGST
jgi:hypothetical protein